MRQFEFVVRTHGPDRCAGEHCVIHNPSGHHMVDWPKHLRVMNLPPIFERTCSHGIGHPDPDSAAWAEKEVRENPGKWQDDEDSDGSYVWVHGCDGCCVQACAGCGTAEGLSYGPDPYADEICDDPTPMYLCDRCYADSCDEI